MKHYTEQDWNFQKLLNTVTLLDGVDPNALPMAEAETVEVYYPDGEYGFTHEAAIIQHKGVLYTAWYNCPDLELDGRTPIRGRRSRDGGQTWEPIEVIADDPTGKIIYCPPVYGVCDGKLYLFLNEMVGADLIHALDLYVLDEETDKFVKLWSKPIPFKLNTNVYALENGKLLLPGRIAELDGFPTTPAVLISDSGKIDGDWRLVKIAENGDLPDGSKQIHPELSAVVQGSTVTVFCRSGERQVSLLYVSRDFGETWEGPLAHDIPFTSSKIYSGTLSNGRHYVIGNIQTEGPQENFRSILAIFFSQPGELRFTQGFRLQDGINPALGYGEMWHYPVAHEADGKLYIIYTASIQNPKRGAVVTILPIGE